MAARVQPYAQQRVPMRPVRQNSAYGDEIDEAGGVGDELDTVSVRDVASVRYVRYHEWMELVVGSAVETSRLVPPRVIPESSSTDKWTFADPESVEAKLKEVQDEIKQLEAGQGPESLDKEVGAKREFYSKAINQLRDQFGAPNSSADKEVEEEFAKALPNHTVIEAERVRKITETRPPPPPPQKPEPVQEQAQDQGQDQQFDLDNGGVDLNVEDVMNALGPTDGDVQMNDADDLGDLLNIPPQAD
uniref:ARAD1C05808p n=1 Tax=Blastobotrys adeninivorans TaxID=409370 RepID=A0A060T077_BLAAD